MFPYGLGFRERGCPHICQCFSFGVMVRVEIPGGILSAEKGGCSMLFSKPLRGVWQVIVIFPNILSQSVAAFPFQSGMFLIFQEYSWIISRRVERSETKQSSVDTSNASGKGEYVPHRWLWAAKSMFMDEKVLFTLEYNNNRRKNAEKGRDFPGNLVDWTTCFTRNPCIRARDFLEA